MVTITVVEPNPLLRLGILQILQKRAPAIKSEGMDYDQLFKGTTGSRRSDLMLLSVPTDYNRMVELADAAQQGYDPKRVLLLSSTPTLPYSLANLPPILAGYISKYSPQGALIAAITLVLADGKCFPSPDAFTGNHGQPESIDQGIESDTRRRRWYDKDVSLAESPPPEAASAEPSIPFDLEPLEDEPQPSTTPLMELEQQPLTKQLIADESGLLDLTPRQYEVLALLGRGHTIKKISCELKISVSTTKAHLESLYQRLSVHNRYSAVNKAYSLGATLGWRKSIPYKSNPR